MEARIKALAILGLPMTKAEEAEYLLLIANDEEFKKYMEAKNGKRKTKTQRNARNVR